MKKIHFQALLTLIVLGGGAYVATKGDQPIEIRLIAAGAAAGSVTYWLKSPLEGGSG